MDQVLESVLALCEDLDSPRSLSVAILARYGLWAEAQLLPQTAPSDHDDADSYLRWHLPGELLRKLELPSESKRLHEKAVSTFYELERANAEANLRLRRFTPEHLLLEHTSDLRILEFFEGVKKRISRLLGPLPRDLTPRFSMGATVGDVGKLTTIPDKMSGRAQLYPSTSALLPLWWGTSWGRASQHRAPVTVRGNVFFSVPKDSTKNRGCAKEASINVSYQLAVAEVIRRRLLEWDIDLLRAQERHQHLACEGSVTGKYATLDLSNASDTLPKVLLKLILPESWLTLLSSLRAPLTIVGGRPVYLEKFSSMGNGFTFELETLVFAALARSLPGFNEGVDTVLVNGDDIIVDTHLAADLLAVLRFCGFQPNAKKTFLSGRFRESCGGDFFDGRPVRAMYLKKIPDEPHRLVAMANQLRALRERAPMVTMRPWRRVLDRIPGAVRRCRGPSTLGDLVIHDEPSRWRKRVVDYPGYQVLFIETWSPAAKPLPWHHWRPEVQLACVTLCDSAGVSPRGSVAGYRHRWVQDPPAPGARWLPHV